MTLETGMHAAWGLRNPAPPLVREGWTPHVRSRGNLRSSLVVVIAGTEGGFAPFFSPDVWNRNGRVTKGNDFPLASAQLALLWNRLRPWRHELLFYGTGCGARFGNYEAHSSEGFFFDATQSCRYRLMRF